MAANRLNTLTGRRVGVLLANKEIITEDQDVGDLMLKGLFVHYDGDFLYLNTVNDDDTTFDTVVNKSSVSTIMVVDLDEPNDSLPDVTDSDMMN